MVQPGGWILYRITDSRHLNATLTEIRDHWTLGDIVDAHRRIDFWEELERQSQPDFPKFKR